MFGFGVSKDLTRFPETRFKNEEELEEGFDLYSQNLFGSQEINWIVHDPEDVKRTKSRSQSCPQNVLDGLLKEQVKEEMIVEEQIEEQTEEQNEEQSYEEIQESVSESSFEDLEVEKTMLKELKVGTIRNFTERDVVLTVLDDQFRKGDLFKTSDQIVIKRDFPVGIDLSNYICYYKSPFYKMLFGLHEQDSEYKYIVFALEEQFHVKKYRMIPKNSESARTETISTTSSNLPGANFVQSYNIGSERNRCINIQKLMLDDSEF